jgi:hypothetical protein
MNQTSFKYKCYKIIKTWVFNLTQNKNQFSIENVLIEKTHYFIWKSLGGFIAFTNSSNEFSDFKLDADNNLKKLNLLFYTQISYTEFYYNFNFNYLKSYKKGFYKLKFILNNNMFWTGTINVIQSIKFFYYYC